MTQERSLGALLGRSGHMAKERMDARLSDMGITPAQAHVILYLHRSGGEAPQQDITRFMKVKPPTVNGILDRMEEKGLICRTVSEADGRCRKVVLTARGRQRQGELEAVHGETEEIMQKGLSQEEREILWQLLCRVVINLEEDRNL